MAVSPAAIGSASQALYFWSSLARSLTCGANVGQNIDMLDITAGRFDKPDPNLRLGYRDIAY